MIEDDTARELREATNRRFRAEAELIAGASTKRRGDVALATEYAQACRAHEEILEEAQRQEQILDEGQ
jgi:hypothetical protein